MLNARPSETTRDVLLAIVFASLSTFPTMAAEKKIDFNRDVRPILSNKCIACHGPDKAERAVGLRLDTREGALADNDGIRAVVPGNMDESELIFRITTEDDDERMPPKKHGKPLSEAEVATLKLWVRQGAPFAKHWSYVKPARPPLPSVGAASWASNAIDRFVLAKLEAEGLKPSPEADRRALARRMSLDLTGLPPSYDEVLAFVNDKSADAVGKYVDKLLAKPGFGEHWARMWLDLARYADSAGYADDPPRTIWQYRDYVIRAFNQNKPFDRFTVEQIAGDMLPRPEDEADARDQLLATAFHRNTQTNNEGGTNDEEFRSVAIVDRVNTTFEVWMGTTMACAQCHTHKYDPITIEEYFQVYAILNQTEDADKRDERPTLVTMTPDAEQRRANMQAQIDALRKQIADAAKQSAAKPKPAYEMRTGPVPIRYLRVMAPGNVFLHIAELEAFEGRRNVAAIGGKATQSSTGYGGSASRAIDGNREGDYQKNSVTHTNQENNPWLEVDLGKEYNLDKVLLWNRTDGNTADRLKSFWFIGMDAKRQPVWARKITKTPKPAANGNPPASFETFTGQDKADLSAYLALKTGKPASPLQKRLQQLQKQLAGIRGVPTPIMRELPANRQRKTLLQHRGNFLDTGPEVKPGVPGVFHAAGKSQRADGLPDRLALAKWLVDKDNPLTARVIVNRFWQQVFGLGLVRTSEEFGSQGEMPSHPQLLDWLAVDFMENGWDVKRLLKQIVTSSTYRQSSKVKPDLLALDPDNRLLARGPRVRLSAEMIRDQALAAAGLLSGKMYGPPVKPPQPSMGLRAAFGGGIDWKTSDGEDRYRRGLYTTWRRSNPYPSMATFDAPNREVCTSRRARTNTPLQAFVTMNDPVYIEAAQGLARRLMTEAMAGKSPEVRVDEAFRIVLSRDPSYRERTRVLALYAKALKRYQQDTAQAKAMATDPIGAAPKGVDVAELAAWTVVSNVMLNLDETLMKR